jgi:hypothetical protein
MHAKFHSNLITFKLSLKSASSKPIIGADKLLTCVVQVVQYMLQAKSKVPAAVQVIIKDE